MEQISRKGKRVSVGVLENGIVGVVGKVGGISGVGGVGGSN